MDRKQRNKSHSRATSEVRQQLRDLAVTPSKRRGQNFLHDQSVIEELVEFARVSEQDNVVEIGPGLGALSSAIWRRCKNSFYVEIDSSLALELVDKLSGIEPHRVLNRDIRSLSGVELFEKFGGNKFVVISNVPYSISTEVVLWILENRQYISRASLLFQKEFAERLASPPGSRDYGSLTVFRSLYANARLGLVVPGDRFFPTTKVDSQAIELQILASPRVEVDDLSFFEQVVRASFGSRRKTLLNSLGRSELSPDKTELSDLLQSIAIDPSRRAETLTLEEFVTLAKKLHQGR